MGSNFHYSIDLNKDLNHHEQPFSYPLGSSSSLLHNNPVVSNSSSSSSPYSSLSSYLPFLINSQEDQHVAYNNTYHADHVHLSQPLKAKMFNGGSSSSYDHMVAKKETRLKLTIRGKYHHEDQTDFLLQNPTKLNSDSNKWTMSPKKRLIKKTITTDHTSNDHKEDHYSLNQKISLEEDHDEDLKKVSPRTTTAVTRENGYNTVNGNGYGSNNGVIRVCSDCNTTKTPLWRSGPRGPKSLCNACGIRQRKARRAAMAAATATGDQEVVAARMKLLPVKKKLQNKKKRPNGGVKYEITPVVANTKKCKIKEEEEGKATVAGYSEISTSTTSSDSSVSSNKLRFDDFTIMLSKSSAYQQVFPQDEKEAAVLLMALSYGMVHG